MNGATFSFEPYLDVIWRHRIAAFCALIVGTSLTLLALVRLPRTYTSSTLLVLSPSQVPVQYAPPTGQGNDFKSRAQHLQQETLSVSSLQPLVRRYGLYARASRLEPLGARAGRMRKNVHIDVVADDEWNKAHWGSMTISYTYTSPEIAQEVTGALAHLFIQDDLADQRREAVAAVTFLSSELNRSEMKLDQKTAEIKSFKDRYQGSLPEDLDLNLKTLSSLQSELERTMTALSSLEERRMEVDQRIALAQQQTVSLHSSSGQDSWPSPEAALSSLETQLAVLKAQYRDDYPDVVSLKAQIAALKRQFGQPGIGDAQTPTPLDQELLKQHSSIAADEERLHARIASLNLQIERAHDRIRDTPVHEQQLAILARDDSVLTDHYHSLLQKVLNAQIYANLVERGDGERLQIIEPASFPSQPAFPKLGPLLGIGIVLTLLGAVGLPFALYFTDSSLKNIEELHTFNVPVVAVIANQIPSGGRRPRAHFVRAALYTCLCLSAGVAALWLWSSTLL
jgi:succinoglycan biosynthesis transport protein ExoP